MPEGSLARIRSTMPAHDGVVSAEFPEDFVSGAELIINDLYCRWQRRMYVAELGTVLANGLSNRTSDLGQTRLST